MIVVADLQSAYRNIEQVLSRQEYSFSVANLVKTVVTLAGMQVEGREVALSLLCCGSTPPIPDDQMLSHWDLPPQVNRALIEAWDPTQAERFIANIRNIVSVTCSSNTESHPVLVLAPDGCVKSIMLLRGRLNLNSLPKLFFCITVEQGWAVWLTNEARSTYQWLRLRDGTGYVLRNLSAIESELIKICQPGTVVLKVGAIVASAVLQASQAGIGGALYILQRTSSPEIWGRARGMYVARSSQNTRHITCLDARCLGFFLGFDGAVVCRITDDNLRIIDWGVYFNGPGGRHKTALHIAQTWDEIAVSIVVSQDGAVTAYNKGGVSKEISDQIRFS